MKRFLNILGLVIMMMGVPGDVHAITSDDLNAVVNNTVFYSDDGVECTLNPTTGAATAVNVTDDLPSGVTTDQKIAQTFILGFDTSTPKDVITDIVTKFHVGGIYLTGDTTGFDKAFFSTLDTAAGTPLTVASDEEGGEIKNFSYTSAFPSAKAMGALPVDQVTTIGKAVGTTLVSDGVTMDLAPVLDLDSGNEDKTKGSPTRNVIGAYERSFSNNPSTISDKAGAFAAGLTSAGIGITFKHFPGLGYSTGALGNDTDNAKVTSPDIATLKTRDLLPYKDLLATYPNATVMLSNENVAGLDANKPASVSPAVVKLLRSDMKFAGAITTDDLNVPSVIGQTGSIASAVSNALKAGVTMPLFSKMGTASTDKATAEKNVQAVIDAVKVAKVSDATINDDITKILALKKAAAVPTAAATAANGSCCDSVGQASTTGSPATPTPVTGNLGTVVIKDKDRATTNAQAIYQFFRDNGATAVGAAGITGNFIDESGTDSNAVSRASSMVLSSGAGTGGTDQMDSRRLRPTKEQRGKP